jgi:hypothetical protein
VKGQEEKKSLEDEHRISQAKEKNSEMPLLDSGTVLSLIAPEDVVTAIAAISKKWIESQSIVVRVDQASIDKLGSTSVVLFAFRGSPMQHINFFQPFVADTRVSHVSTAPSFKNSFTGLSLSAGAKAGAERAVWTLKAPTVNRVLSDLIFLGAFFKFSAYTPSTRIRDISPRVIVVAKRAELLLPKWTFRLEKLPESSDDRYGRSAVYDPSSVFAPKVEGLGMLITYAAWVLPFMEKDAANPSTWIADFGASMRVVMRSDPELYYAGDSDSKKFLPAQFTFLADGLDGQDMRDLARISKAGAGPPVGSPMEMD